MPDSFSNETVLYGIGGSPGICIGRAYLVDKEGVDVVPKYAVPKTKVEPEKKRFKAAVKRAMDELRKIISENTEGFREPTNILETHLVLLKDKMLFGRTIDMIHNEHINAEWALKKVISELRPMFEGMEDPYLRDRAEDVLHVSNRIMKNLTGAEGINISSIDKRVILVARDLSPAETSQIQLERVMGFVTDRGGRASHTSIIARSLEIPAVLGLENATTLIRNEDIIIVDGISGVVVVNPSEQTLVEAAERKARHENRRAEYARKGHLPAQTMDGRRLSVMGNIEQPEEVVAVLDKGGDGIGLYRTEFQYLARAAFPTEDELFENYKGVIEVMPDKPVTIRTLDINGDKAMAGTAEPDEANPVLGLRAIRYCLQKPGVFKTQLRAILRAARFGEVRILIPMISQLEEIRATKRLLSEAAAELSKAGVPHRKGIKLGVMIEVPSAALIADIIAKEVDFFSIGTNDLIQYTMAIDRGNRHVAYLYNPLHPAVLRLLKQIIDAGLRNNTPVYMCGEMAGEPLYIPILLGLGLSELSTDPQTIPIVKNAVRMLDLRETRRFVEKILTLEAIEDIEHMVNRMYGELLNNNHQAPWES
jgi:phosphoenolpyruvate-protein phosphotransferase (PTS system enzyme I)